MHQCREHTDFAESTEEIKPLTEEEKKARLAELKAGVAEKRAKQAVIDKEEQRKNEVWFIISFQFTSHSFFVRGDIRSYFSGIFPFGKEGTSLHHLLTTLFIPGTNIPPLRKSAKRPPVKSKISRRTSKNKSKSKPPPQSAPKNSPTSQQRSESKRRSQPTKKIDVSKPRK